MKFRGFSMVQTNNSRSGYKQNQIIKAYRHTNETIYKLQIHDNSIVEWMNHQNTQNILRHLIDIKQ